MKRRKNRNPDPLDRHLASLPKEAIHEMELAVDAAWDNPDPVIRARQRELFGDKKPTVEEFIRAIAAKIQNDK